MGQAKVETPPLSSAPAADDILSQMAGDEIDRLLAEAENDPIPPDVAKAVIDDPEPVGAPEQAVASAVAPAPVSPPSDSISPPVTTPSEAFEETKEASPIVEKSVPATVASSEDVAAPANAPLSAPPKPPSESAADSAAVAALPHSNELGTVEIHEPFLVRLLERMNAPLDHFDDAVRRAIGWIAILTLFNATVVLGYVHFFRHR